MQNHPLTLSLLVSAYRDNGAIDSLSQAFAWHMRQILVEREPAFESFRSQLGLPAAIQSLPVRKTVQFPANAINADEGQNDGNWEVLKSLLEQARNFVRKSERLTNILCYRLMSHPHHWRTM
jgi:hypothetical protein